MQFIDTHVHLMMPDFEGKLEPVLERAQEAGVAFCIAPGIDLKTSRQALELHNKYPQIIPAIGLHPQSPDEPLEDFADLAALPEVKAIGEIGTDARGGEWGKQEARLRSFLELAIKLKKPALLHVLQTWEPTFKILADYPELKGKVVIHCFSGGPSEAKQAAELGVLLSFTAIIARTGMEETHEVIKDWPLEAMMLETDAPWLGWPGEEWPNEPKTIMKIAQKVAEIRGLPLEEVAAKTTQTAKAFFSL